MSVTAAAGFVASGVHAGIRRSGLDLALVRSTEPAVGAAVWTTNRVLAAPVVVSKRHLETAEPQAVVVNAGVANAATGQAGIADAERTADEVAAAVGIEPSEVVVLSTGVIGVPLPMERVLAGVREAFVALSADGGADAAAAILTTDRGPKRDVVCCDGFVVGGMAKGAGMIHPRLATMLAVVTTDYPLGPGEASDFLCNAVEESFNTISVDGECSTNDTVVLLANGASEATRSAASDTSFDECLRAVCADLAGQIVTDGEGATFTAAISVSGAASDLEAKAIARRIATSPLVKTALFGRDANWGRVLAAAGSAPYNGGYAQLDPDCVTLDLAGVRVVDAGAPQAVEPTLDGAGCTIVLDLALGKGSASYLTSDLSYDYVRINAEYRT